jgi:hypothetical protein
MANVLKAVEDLITPSSLSLAESFSRPEPEGMVIMLLDGKSVGGLTRNV